ncbi:MAG: hypothetical protein HYV14_17580 [Elusimicrobia bacterium]|nr:hypothetical protein [Elusimicrobiota bacterium]
MSRMLAERRDGGPGMVSLCDGCEDVHIRWGELTLSLGRSRFLELVRMLNEAARLIGVEPRRADAGAERGAAWTH